MLREAEKEEKIDVPESAGHRKVASLKSQAFESLFTEMMKNGVYEKFNESQFKDMFFKNLDSKSCEKPNNREQCLTPTQRKANMLQSRTFGDQKFTAPSPVV